MIYEAEPRVVTPLETMVKTNPAQVVEFLDGSTVIRSILNAREHDGKAVIAPLRGAMPFLWSSQGVPGLEGELNVHEIAAPLGNYQNVTGEGAVKTTSPNFEQKTGILKDIFAGLTDEQSRHMLLIDEVQKGGTLSTVTEITERIMRKRHAVYKLGVIAVQDSRQRVVGQPKTEQYEKIASNSFSPFVKTNVVAMPLISTDRDALLDTVELAGNREDRHLSLDRFEIIRNSLAETLLRGLGTISRDSDVRHDDNFVYDLMNSQGELSEPAAGRAEVWMPNLIALLDRKGTTR